MAESVGGSKGRTSSERRSLRLVHVDDSDHGHIAIRPNPPSDYVVQPADIEAYERLAQKWGSADTESYPPRWYGHPDARPAGFVQMNPTKETATVMSTTKTYLVQQCCGVNELIERTNTESATTGASVTRPIAMIPSDADAELISALLNGCRERNGWPRHVLVARSDFPSEPIHIKGTSWFIKDGDLHILDGDATVATYPCGRYADVAFSDAIISAP